MGRHLYFIAKLKHLWWALLLLAESTVLFAAEIDCVELAADKYQIPSRLVRAILSVEGGKTGQAVNNTNGTEDLGPMQINTIWLSELNALGISRNQLQNDRCVNILVGSWILARHLKKAKTMPGSNQRRLWWAVGAYHSKTPARNVAYALKVWRKLQSDSTNL